uniref:RING-type E3 ubiquitin transferase n=1 Tax=Leersia perrieri TaxID=77586 RepID=A0A0D9XAZ3_9ORYZ
MGGAWSSSFLVLLVSIVSILSTAMVLLLCYLLLACSLRPRQSQSQSPPPPSVTTIDLPRRGLDEAIIRRIPTLRYQLNNSNDDKQQAQCAVCLADFREGERLRRLPPCLHIDCIDAWLAAALTCPLCRTHVAVHDAIAAFPAATSETRQPNNDDEPLLSGVHQPMRRSLSLDSCAIVLQQLCCSRDPQGRKEEGNAAAVSVSGRRLRRSFFSFSFSSPSPILPV